MSDQKKINPLLLRSSNGCLEAVHICHAVNKGMACKHLRSAILLAEKWLGRSLPNAVEVDKRWLTEEEMFAIKDLTPQLLQKKGGFTKIKLIKGGIA